jgi:hypothetical protein
VVDCLARMSIGRDERADLALTDAKRRVSRQHAELTREADGSWVVRDCGSRNGILVNDRVVATQILKHNDVVRIGPYRLRFLSDALDASESVDLLASHATIAPTDQRQFEAVAYGSVNGPDALNQRQLRAVRRFLEELAELTSAAAVANASCRLLCEELGAGASMLLTNPRGAEHTDLRVIEQCVTREFDVRATDGPGVSQSLVSQVLTHRKPMLASASASAPGGWSFRR